MIFTYSTGQSNIGSFVYADESTADWLIRGPHSLTLQVVLDLMCANWEELSLTKVLVHIADLNVWLGCKERGYGLCKITCEEQQLLQRLLRNKVGGTTRPAFQPVMRHPSQVSV